LAQHNFCDTKIGEVKNSDDLAETLKVLFAFLKYYFIITESCNNQLKINEAIVNRALDGSMYRG